MEKIIDIHMHLGDLLEGRNIIYKKGIIKELEYGQEFDPGDFVEEALFDFSKFEITEETDDITIGQRARNFTATLENIRQAMDATGAEYRCCPMPVLPNIGFDDLLAASKLENRLMPFTCLDYDLGKDAGKQAVEDITLGAQGLKIHPILQKKSLDDDLTTEALETYYKAKTNKPVLIHTGVASYYIGEDQLKKQNPEFGDIEQFAKIARQFSGIDFIAGHGGLFERRQLYESVKDLKNVYVDTTFSGIDDLQFYFESYGPEKVMYGTDWPWGNIEPHIKALKLACKGDHALEKAVFYENAKQLLNLDI